MADGAAGGAVEIWTDGACSGNPGPGGWGAVLRSGGHERELYGGEAAPTTNNRMELTAAIQALESLTRPVTVQLHTDSTYVRNGITGWLAAWKRNGWLTAAKQPVKNADLWRRLEAACAIHHVSWHWVKGHNGHPENERADALANRGMAEAKRATARATVRTPRAQAARADAARAKAARADAARAQAARADAARAQAARAKAARPATPSKATASEATAERRRRGP